MKKLIENKKVVILSVSAGVALMALGAVSARIFTSPAKPAAHAAQGAHDDVQAEGHETHGAHATHSPQAEDEQAEELTAHDSHAPEHDKAPVQAHSTEKHPEGFFSKLLHTYGQAFVSIQSKVDELKRAEEENVRLRMENAHYRVQAEQFALGCRTAQAKAQAEKAGEGELHLSAIEYRAPEHLLPEQRYALGVSYFKAREDEKAVINFNLLTDHEEDTTYKTAQTYLMLGVAWYRLDNHKLADEYFTRALKAPSTDGTAKYHAQARLWRAVIAQVGRKTETAQTLLKDLIAHHPHSTEAAWVNPKEGGRMPASKPKKKRAAADSHGKH